MHLTRSPGPLSFLGILGLLIFSAALVASILATAPLPAGFSVFMIVACWLWARVPPKAQG